ncbi:MAG: linear amide C-N hydrolase [Candidatus Obscuribacter sp.]|nr:linear amide C-N hydrolase [Candidatus Obscuribacter sp.]
MASNKLLNLLAVGTLLNTLFGGCTWQSAQACTDFLLQANDRSAIVGRSMEWGLDLDSQIWQHNRGQLRTSTAPDGKSGVRWTSKYGYLGLDAHSMPLALDGINEKGLSMGQLWLPGTVYQKVPGDHPEVALSVVDLGHWVLGNFATVDEVKAAIGGVKIWAPEMADWGGIPTCHLALHDATGKSVVIEFVGGEQKIYDNLGHVLTNAPTFDWHLTNLRNYIKVSSANASPITVGDSVLAPPGQGGGFLGIPGDWTPPSRFVRTSAMLNFAKPANNAAEGITLAQHLLNAVDIPLGDVRTAKNDLEHSDYTQWVVVKDLTNRVLYFRSYYNQALCQIDLKKLDFGSGTESRRLMAVSGGISSLDMTDLLPGAKGEPSK